MRPKEEKWMENPDLSRCPLTKSSNILSTVRTPGPRELAARLQRGNTSIVLKRDLSPRITW